MLRAASLIDRPILVCPSRPREQYLGPLRTTPESIMSTSWQTDRLVSWSSSSVYHVEAISSSVYSFRDIIRRTRTLGANETRGVCVSTAWLLLLQLLMPLFEAVSQDRSSVCLRMDGVVEGPWSSPTRSPSN